MISLCVLCAYVVIKIFRMATIIEINKLTYKILGAAIEVHKVLGPGLLESVYQRCLKKELNLRKLRYASEFLVPVNYKGESLEADLRCDFLVEDEIVVELKATDAIAPVHEAQLLTYMKLLRKPKGILINFNCSNLFKEGQRTYVNDYFRTLPEH
jgi:GxxExxY protein